MTCPCPPFTPRR